MNCSLSVNNSCFGVIKRKLYLQHYPQFTQSKVLMQVLISYENLAFLLLMRGLPDLALNSLKMVSKILKHSPPTWLSKMERIICRVNGLYSLAYLGVGETAKAAVLISAAEMQKQSHFDAYTNSCVTYMNTFHLAAKGEFQAAFNGCMESIEVLSFIGELGLAHLIRISAGWYSFIIGNVNRARELYEEVFEYGLSTAHRPLIKMSMELYASILILSGDFASANAMLDHLKSPLQASDSREATLRPSSIKSSLITMSCVLDKRYIEAIPHIQFSCRTLAEINPANVICGVYLFFAAYSALEVLVNLSLLEFHERVTANIVLNEAIGLSMSALERCSHSIPCLRLLYEVCIVKRQRMNPAASMSTISEIDAVIKKLAGEKEIELGMPYLHTSTNETNNTFPQLGSKGIARKEYSSMVVLANSNASPSSQHSSMMLNDHSRKGVWESVGNIGVFDEFTLGKLFYHREREALCKVVHADKKFKESNFDSGILYLKLSRLYHRELSYSSLLPVYYDVPIEHAPENSFHVDKIVPVRSDISDNSFRLPLAEESSIGGTDCTVKDFNRVVEDADSSVYVQLDKLRAYELMQGLEVDELPVAMAGIGSLKRYTSEKGGSFNQDKATLPDLKPRRLFPIGATIRIAPTALIDNDKSPKIKQKQSNVRRGSR